MKKGLDHARYRSQRDEMNTLPMAELSTPQQQLYDHNGRKCGVERKAVSNRSTVLLDALPQLFVRKHISFQSVTSCLLWDRFIEACKGVMEMQTGSLSQVKGSISVYSCQFPLFQGVRMN